MTLEADLVHYRAMSTAQHKPECGIRVLARFTSRWVHPAPTCGGCNPGRDRELFDRLAYELERHLARDEHVDLFGGVAIEPTEDDR